MTTQAQITYANLFSQARSNILALIETAANVPDPVGTTGQFRKWIYSREPDVKDSEFAGYPFIVVHPSDVDASAKRTVDGRSGPVSWTLEIEIVASDRGYSGKAGQGLIHIDAISDDIMATLLNISNRKTLRNYGMALSQPVSTPVTTEPIAQELVFRRSIMQEMKTRMQVSS